MLYAHQIVMLFIILFCLGQSTHAQTVIQVYYDERIPYAITDDSGKVHGLTATPVADAFDSSGIPFEWKKMPFKRQLITIKTNKKRACGIGWFKKTEREDFARYSIPIYQDKPTIIISKNGNGIFTKYSTIAEVIKDNSIKLLIKDDFSYGQYLDKLIDKEQPNKFVVVGSSNMEMLQLILSGRSDYFFAAEEEAEEIIRGAGFKTSQFDLLRFTDMPTGNNRYLACSKQVPVEVIDQLNQALNPSK